MGRGLTVNVNSIVKSLTLFMRRLRPKGIELAQVQWFLPWGKSSVHATAVAQDWLAATCFQDVPHLLYWPDVTPTDLFLFLKLLKELAGRTLPAKTLKTTWDGVIRIVSACDFTAAFAYWLERCKKYFQIRGLYAKRNYKIIILISFIFFILLTPTHLI